MDIYVLRHGQTDANLQEKMLGRTDVKLNETGIMQAKEAVKLVEEIDYDYVFCSPLLRTKQTCKLANAKNREVIYDSRLIERDFGILEGTYTGDFDYSSYWYINREPYEREESMQQVIERVYSFLDEIIHKYNSHNILVVTHNGVCRAIKCYFENIPKDENIIDYGQKNAEIKKYSVK